MFGINPYSKSPFIALGAVFSNTVSEAIGQTPYSVLQKPSIASFAIAGSPFSGDFNTTGYLDNPSYVVQSNLLNAINENINVTEIKSNTVATSFSIVEAWGQTPYSVPQNPGIASFAIAGSPFSGNFNTTGYLENPQYIVQSDLLNAINENTNITENNIAISQFLNSLNETVTFADSRAQSGQFISNIVEPITVTENNIAISQFLNSITENTNLNDSSAQISTFSVSLTEPNTVDDVRVINAVFAVNLNENSNLANAQSIAVQFVGVVFENINISNINTINAAYVQFITENILTEDPFVITVNTSASIVESITLSDTGYIFLIDLIEILVAQANQSYSEIYVYDALASVDSSGIINTISYDNITAVAELGEIGVS